jgi:hypothetical protein
MLQRSGGAGLAITVAPSEGGAGVRLGLVDLPESYREPVVDALRAELIARCLTADERARLARGATDVSRLAAVALTRAVAMLAQDWAPDAVATVVDLADLLALEGRHVPFDAQTTFARVRARAGGAAAAALEPVAHRLGFADGTEGA